MKLDKLIDFDEFYDFIKNKSEEDFKKLLEFDSNFHVIRRKNFKVVNNNRHKKHLNGSLRGYLKYLSQRYWVILRFFIYYYHFKKGIIVQDKKYYMSYNQQYRTGYWQDTMFKPESEYLDLSLLSLNYINYLNEFKLAYELLKDTKSKDVFFAIIKTRITKNLEYLQAVKEDYNSKQYIINKINFSNEDTDFVDVGAYDGDTAELFFSQYKNFQTGILFEPNPINANLIKKRFNRSKFNIILHEFGLSDSDKEELISIKGSSSSYINNSENKLDKKFISKTKKLDNIIKSRVSFIKMDIEGFELLALKGAKQTIAKYEPILAICVYHKTNDLFEILLFIHSINPNYDFYLRHYSWAPVETVLYAIPKKRVFN